jgi:hypothetical protein
METSNLSEDLPFPAHLEVLPEWEGAARRFLEAGGTALAPFTPLPAEAAPLVRFVELGNLRLNLEGEELPHV